MSDVIPGELDWTLADEVVMDEELQLPFDEQSETVVQPDTGTITVPSNIINIISNAPSGQAILQTCIDLAVFLASKNISYGDSALNPIRVFSKATATEQLLVRIDDKINRLMKGSSFEGDNDIVDLAGYLILYLASKENDGSSNQDE